MRFSHRLVSWPYSSDSIQDIQPAPSGNWAVLTKDGVLAILDDLGVELRSLRISMDGLDPGKPVMLRLSRDGRIAAVAEEFGTRGRVFDLTSGETLMNLTRGEYHVAHCSFPLAFFEHDEKTLLVHGTDWNRLDLSEPLTGTCLSDRRSPEYVHGVEEPEHYLDYFHTRLTVSPDHKWIFDNGWHWHPLGTPRTWSLDAWVNENVWESEDGDSLRELRSVAYLWDAPIAWIDEKSVAVWGLGEDLEEEDPLRPGVRIFDVTTGEEKTVIEGMNVEPHELRPRDTANEGWIAFDIWLLAVSPKTGTTVWDLGSHQCLHNDPELTPRLYHPVAKSFLSLEGTQARVSHLLTEQRELLWGISRTCKGSL